MRQKKVRKSPQIEFNELLGILNYPYHKPVHWAQDMYANTFTSFAGRKNYIQYIPLSIDATPCRNLYRSTVPLKF